MASWTGRSAAVLLAASALTGGVVAAVPARAQDATQLRAIEGQIAQLQAQLKQLQRQAAQRDAELKQAQQDAAQAKADAQKAASAQPAAPAVATAPVLKIPPGTVATPVVLIRPDKPDANGNLPPSGRFQVGGLTITLGGYFDLTSVYRSSNVTSGAGTPFNAIPFANSPNAHESEFRETAQNTRISVLFEGKPTETINVAGYLETDFNGAATTSNNAESNSYTPRLRQAFVQADESTLGLHGLAGQAWSLSTLYTSGLTARKEAVPPTIDANYLPGWVYLRVPQLRIVKDFGQKYWLGLSLETPQSAYAFTPTTASGGVIPPVNNNKVGTTVTYNNPGGTFLNSGANYSVDVAPDIIGKAAADTRFGHYEVYGLGRWFKTRTATIGSAETQVSFGGGVGGGAYIPIWPKYIELQGNVLAGYGVGRYGSGQLPDASFKGNGEPAPLPEIIASAGVIGHPVPQVDLYSFLGTEQIGRSTYPTGLGPKATGNGYGTASVNVSGCDVETGTVTVTPVCNAQTRALWNVTAGAWWRFLHGSYGTLQAGAQYSYTKRTAFHGAANATGSVGATPNADENAVFFTIRYLPFQ